MKMFVVVGLAAAMALTASAAVAFDNDWLIHVRASTDAAAKTGQASATFGWKSSPGDVFDQITILSLVTSGPEIDYADAMHQFPNSYGGYPAQKRWYTAKFGGPWPKTTTWFCRAAGTEYSTIFVTAWNYTGASSSIDADPGFTLKLYEANAWGDVLGAPVWIFQPGVTATWSAGSGIGGNPFADYFQKAYTLGPADSGGAAYKYFVLTMTTSPTIPEPGSLACLLAGVSWLAGMGIRRKTGVKCQGSARNLAILPG
jgi:hypothetical protein